MPGPEPWNLTWTDQPPQLTLVCEHLGEPRRTGPGQTENGATGSVIDDHVRVLDRLAAVRFRTGHVPAQPAAGARTTTWRFGSTPSESLMSEAAATAS